MGNKIFVSYKYADKKVKKLDNEDSTPRNYVDKIIEKLGEEDVHIYKGEEDGNDLSKFKEETIKSKLKDKIYDSSVTIVLISKGMKDCSKKEEEQWIPWEISYSLKEIQRNDRTSKTNALLSVVLPDKNGDYDYFAEKSECDILNIENNNLFSIIYKNMFNKKNLKEYICKCGQHNFVSSSDRPHYLSYVFWDDFLHEMDYYIKEAIEIKENKNDYNIKKEI